MRLRIRRVCRVRRVSYHRLSLALSGAACPTVSRLTVVLDRTLLSADPADVRVPQTQRRIVGGQCIACSWSRQLPSGDDHRVATIRGAATRLRDTQRNKAWRLPASQRMCRLLAGPQCDQSQFGAREFPQESAM